jgi:hypothetical protein
VPKVYRKSLQNFKSLNVSSKEKRKYYLWIYLNVVKKASKASPPPFPPPSEGEG